MNFTDLNKHMVDFVTQHHTDWWYSLALAALLCVFTLIAAYAGARMAQDGNTASNAQASLRDATDQLRKAAQTIETLKIAVTHNDWASREWLHLRRVKLEELVTASSKLTAWLNSEEPLADDTESPLAHMHALMVLYFPELQDSITRLADEAAEIAKETQTLHDEASKANKKQREALYEQAEEKLKPRYDTLAGIQDQLFHQSRKLMKKLTKGQAGKDTVKDLSADA